MSRPHQVVVVGAVVNHDVVLVWVVVPEVARPEALLARAGIVDFLAQVPIERRVMPEP